MTATIPALPVQKRPASAWKIALGIGLLLVAGVNGANVKSVPGDVAGAIGTLTGVLLLVLIGGCLIASGLPRTIGNNDIKNARHKIWYRLMGLGFLVMLAGAIAFAALSLFIAAVLVTWAYWFGWTWISWRLADKRAVRQLQQTAQIASAPANLNKN
jgi:hypothetical protein